VLRNISAFLIWTFGIAKIFDYGAFCMAHYLLAVSYREMATNTQRLLRGENAKVKTTTDKVVHIGLLFLNVAVPIFYGYILIAYRTPQLNGEKPAPWISQSYFGVCQVICLLQVYSGFILIRSVMSIRRFFIEEEAEDHLNTAMLIRHAICFALYIVTTAVYFIALGIWILYPTD
jgi:hypothetical protein